MIRSSSPSEKVKKLIVRIDDRVADLDQPVKVTQGGKELFNGSVERTVGTMVRTLVGRGDPKLVFDGEVAVELK
jgi:hypothetical protein